MRFFTDTSVDRVVAKADVRQSMRNIREPVRSDPA